jgi:hypothetical protein
MAPAPCVGFATLPDTLSGVWREAGFPPHVALLGRSFTRSDTWKAPYPGVVAQYREDVDHGSMHLFVHDDRSWTIDHIDDANPERGHVLEHAIRDVLPTPVGALLFTGALLLVVAGVSYTATRR